MSFIKNYPELASSDSRKLMLNVIEAGLSSIQFDSVMEKDFSVSGAELKVQDKNYNLKDFERIFLIAFGKGSAAVSKIIEDNLGGLLTRGFAIDASELHLQKVEFTLGTHPLPTKENIEFSKKVLDQLKGLTERDLVLVVICGGGSVLFEVPHKINLEKLIEVNKALLSSGADIFEMNTIRKHLSSTKGGGLAQKLYPAKVVSLIFSDVPGNDLSFIASGPTVKDETTVKDALDIYKKYNLTHLNLSDSDFTETPKDGEVFSHVDNILMLSNLNALNAMKLEAEKWGIKAEILSDKFQSDAAEAPDELIKKTKPNSMLLVGGETTVKVKNKNGQGGRNHHLVLSGLKLLDGKTLIASVDSDGWDNTPSAGAMGDSETIEKMNEKGLNAEKYLEESNSYLFFKEVGDAIITNRLPSNVADLIIVYKHS